MGRNQSRNTDRFLASHPYCCLCGGSVEATTTEHAPPITLFVNRNLPSNNHTVPACVRCNVGSKGLDQVTSLAALVQRSASNKNDHEYIQKAIVGVGNNIPEALSFFHIEESEDKEMLVDGKQLEVSKVPIDPLLFEKYLDPWAAKQAFALYYLKTRKILNENARVVVRWQSSVDIDSSNIPITLFESLSSYGILEQGKKNSRGQYEYRWQIEESYGCFVIVLHESSMALLAIYLNSEDAQKHLNLPVFATSGEKGIHRISRPWFQVNGHNIPGTT